MRNTRLSMLISLVLGTPAAFAGTCDAVYHFDGNVDDASGNGYHGQVVDAAGALTEPEFVEGRFGQAVRFTGAAAMRAFVDLDLARCPRITISAWLKIEPHPNQAILDNVRGIRLYTSGSRIGIRGLGADLWAQDTVYANAGWMFVAAVWEAESGTQRLYVRGRWHEGKIGAAREIPEAAIWLGVSSGRFHNPARDVVIDELNIVGDVLDDAALATLQQRPAATTAGTEAGTPADTQSEVATWSGRACSAPDDCGAGAYCGIDRLCHPDSHAPMASSSGGSSPSQPAVAFGNTPEIGDFGDRPATDPLAAAGTGQNDGTTFEEMQAEMAQRNAERVGTIDVDRPAGPLALGGADAADSGASAPAPGSTTSAASGQTDASAASGAGEQSADGGLPHPVGAPAFSSISGWEGDMIRTVDLVDTFAFGIRWWQVDDRPCQIAVRGYRTSVEELVERFNCRDDGPANGNVQLQVEFFADPWYAAGIGRLKVCNNNNNSRLRLKGVQIWGDRIHADGSTSYIPNSDSHEFPNCTDWGTDVLCPNDHLATGLVVHGTATGGSEQIVGLQLVCRRIASPG